MKNKWRLVKILITVILLGFLLSFSLKRFSEKPVENISIDLKQSPVYFIDEKDIKEIVKQYNPTNKIGALNIPGLEKKINALPNVDSANVYLNLNGNLNLNIKQRIPVFRLLNGRKDFYVDEKGIEFPLSKNYSYPCMLVSGNVQRSEYKKLAELIKKIDADSFSKNYFVGITKTGNDYNLLTNEGNYKVELGDLGNIDFKLHGFKAFVEKYLISQDPEKYSKISLKFNNQIVTTLNSHYQPNDSIINVGRKELVNLPLKEIKKEAVLATNEKKIDTPKPTLPQPEKPKEVVKPKELVKPKEKPKEKQHQEKKPEKPIQKPEKKLAKKEVKKEEKKTKQPSQKTKATIKIE